MTEVIVGGQGGSGEGAPAQQPSAPGAEQTQPGGGGTGAGNPPASGGAAQTTETAAGAAPPVPERKPIKPIRGNVPGLVQAEAQEQPRGPDGKFAPKEGALPVQPKQEPRVAKAPPAPAGAAPSGTGPIEFLGEKFENMAALEHNVRSLRGVHKTMVSDREQAIAVANAWKERAEQAERQLAEKGAAAPVPGQPAAQPNADEQQAMEEQFLEQMDWSTYNQLQARDPLAATMFAMREQIKFMREQFNGSLDTRFQPIEQQRQVNQAIHYINDLVANLGETKLADGTYAYPELRDEATMEAVGRNWRDFGLPPKLIFTPQGLHLAVLQYRHVRSGAPGVAPAVQGAVSSASAAQTTQQAGPSPEELAAAAAVVTGVSVPATRTVDGGNGAIKASRVAPLKLVAPGVLP